MRFCIHPLVVPYVGARASSAHNNYGGQDGRAPKRALRARCRLSDQSHGGSTTEGLHRTVNRLPADSLGNADQEVVSQFRIESLQVQATYDLVLLQFGQQFVRVAGRPDNELIEA